MKTFKKIDLFYEGEYLFSTNWSRTCREAKREYLELIRYKRRKTGFGRSIIESEILKTPDKLKAFFDKDRK